MIMAERSGVKDDIKCKFRCSSEQFTVFVVGESQTLDKDQFINIRVPRIATSV